MQINSYTSSSNKKKFIWIKLTLFIILLSIILYNIGAYFEDMSEQNQGLTYYKITWNHFYDLEPDTLDLFFLGSSHAYCTFDPEIIDDELGISSFNLGSPLQHGYSSYFVLKEALKYQKPDTLVFEIYWDMLDDEFELTQANAVIQAVDNEEFEDEFVREVFPLNELIKYHFKPVRYQQDIFNYWNRELTEKVEENLSPLIEEQEGTPGESYHKGRGFIYSDIVIPDSEFYETNQFVGFDGSKWEFDKTQKEYVEKLVQLAKEEGIEVIFVTAPIANVSMEYIENYHVLHDTVADFAKDLDIPYRDYNIVNMEKNLFVNENFRDDAHLNFSGVEIFMEDFMKWYQELR